MGDRGDCIRSYICTGCKKWHIKVVVVWNSKSGVFKFWCSVPGLCRCCSIWTILPDAEVFGDCVGPGCYPLVLSG